MRNIKLILEYDGTEFCGWQRQRSERTVQEEVERSLCKLTEEDIKLIAAGRTDSGVHAMAQVVNFKTNSSLPIEVFVRGGNSRLPRDVRILSATDVDENFSARYSARRRTYRYYISTRPLAVGRFYAWTYWNPLNIEPMQNACLDILGTHDFSSFCQAKAEVEHYLCDVRHAWWYKQDHYVVFEICANRFLHNMVRVLVGSMVEIGDEKKESPNVATILQKKDRNAAGPTAPAVGLFLVHVDY